MEYPSPAASCIDHTDVIEVEDEPSMDIETSLIITSRESQVNPFIEELLEDYPDIGHGDFNPFLEDLQKECSRLKEELKVGLEEQIPKFLNDGKIEEAKQQVEEVLNMFYAIKYLLFYRLPMKKPADAGNDTEKKKSVNETEKEIHQIDLFNTLFIHALHDIYSKRSNVSIEQIKRSKTRLSVLDSKITGEPLEYYAQTEFMVFLVKKVQRDWYLTNAFGDLKDCLFTKCIRKYEEESFAACISHVREGELNEAEKLLDETIKCMKPEDVINRGRVYNSVLQEAAGDHLQLAQGQFQVAGHQLQVAGDQLHGLAQNRVDYFVDLFLKDKDFVQQLTFGWMEQHDYPYLILCVWECYNRQNIDVSKLCSRNGCESLGVQPGVLVQYAFHAAIAEDRLDIIEGFILQEWPDLDINVPYKGITALHIAVYKGHEELVKYLLGREKLDINVRTAREKPGNKEKSGGNRWKFPQHRTALHMATEHGYANVVQLLCRGEHPHQKSIRCHEEDANDITALDIVYGKLKPEIWKNRCYQHGKQECVACYASYKDIEKLLVSIVDVQKGIDKLYRNRQVHVDAANTILVGAALIASVTFAGWLQPPLGYAQYYDLPTPSPAPPGTYDSYVGVEGNVGIQVFAIFNSLSFFFAIATVIVGADAAFPMHESRYIGDVVKMMKLLLRRAIKFLMISVVCVLGAFGSAAVVILPPHVYFRKHLVLTIFIGGCVCSVVLWQLLTRHSERVKRFNAYIIHIISKHTNIF